MLTGGTEIDYNLFLPNKNLTTNKLVESAAKIALNNFDWLYLTLVFYNSSLLRGLEMFVTLYDKSVVVSKGHFNNITQDIHQFVIIGRTVENIDYTLQGLKRSTFDNTGKFLVICLSEEENECNESVTVETLWRLKIINVLFVKINEEHQVECFTYFHPEDCNSVHPVRSVEFIACIDNKTLCDKMYPVKFKNLRGCQLIVSTFIQPPYMDIKDGKPMLADGDLLHIIAKYINASLKVITPVRGEGWGDLDRNGTWIGSLGDVFYEYANLSITFASITEQRYADFHLSNFYNTIKLIWVTHPNQPESSSLKLTYPFQRTTLVAVAVSFLTVIILDLIIKTNILLELRLYLKILKPDCSLAFHSWEIFMGLPIKKLPKTAAVSCVFLAWIWYTWLIRTTYQSSLYNSLMHYRQLSNVETTEELLKENYSIGGGSALKYYYLDDPRIVEKWIDLNMTGITVILSELAEGKKFGLAINKQTLVKFEQESKIKLHILKERVNFSPAAIFFKKFSPLVKTINPILNRLVESGIAHKLLKDHVGRTHINGDEDQKEPIKKEHYAGCYAILFFGWCISFLVFLYEYCIEIFRKIMKYT